MSKYNTSDRIDFAHVQMMKLWRVPQTNMMIIIDRLKNYIVSRGKPILLTQRGLWIIAMRRINVLIIIYVSGWIKLTAPAYIGHDNYYNYNTWRDGFMKNAFLFIICILYAVHYTNNGQRIKRTIKEHSSKMAFETDIDKYRYQTTRSHY